MVKQYEVYWITLDPTIGKEIKKTRPCVVISPDEMNKGLTTVSVAPLTSVIRDFPFRSSCIVSGKNGSIVLEQIRCIDKTRLTKKIALLKENEIERLKSVLDEMLIK